MNIAVHNRALAPVVAFALTLACQPVAAATLYAHHGGVLVSTGGSYAPVPSEQTQVRSGDRVLVNPGFSASLFYDSGCSIELHHGHEYIVDEHPPCARGQHGDAAGQQAGQQPVEGGEWGASAEGGVEGAATAAVDATTVAIGVAAVAGVAGLVVSTGGGSDSPSSP